MNNQAQPAQPQGEWTIGISPMHGKCIRDEKERVIASIVCGTGTITPKQADDHAQRIVKCVNGWNGLIATIKEMLKEAEDACTFHGNNPDKSPDIIKWRKFLKQAEQK